MTDLKSLFALSTLALMLGVATPSFACEDYDKHTKDGNHKDHGKHEGHKEGDGHDHDKEKAGKPEAKGKSQ